MESDVAHCLKASFETCAHDVLKGPKRFYSGFCCICLSLGHVGLDKSSGERF